MNNLFKPLLQPELPKVSVIIPTYNRADLVQRAIHSVLKQSVTPMEIIVVDDASTDHTDEILAQFENKISIIKHSENMGVSTARNTGIKAARGNWMAFLDSDDTWQKDKLKTQIKFIQRHPTYKIVHCNETWLRNGSVVSQKKHHRKASNWAWEECLSQCTIGPSCTLIHRSIVDSIGLFDSTLPACEDYDLWNRITRFYPVGLAKPSLVTKHAGHKNQLSLTTPFLDKYRLQSLKKATQKRISPK